MLRGIAIYMPYSSLTFTDCGSTTFLPKVVNVNPSPLVTGQTGLVEIEGITHNVFESGEASIQISVGGFPLTTQSVDICKTTACPISAEEAFDIKYNVAIPSFAPKGNYGLHITVKDQTGNEVGCLDVKTEVN